MFVMLSGLQVILFAVKSIETQALKFFLCCCKKHNKFDIALSDDFYDEIDYSALINEL
jgi:hypothetical protein